MAVKLFHLMFVCLFCFLICKAHTNQVDKLNIQNSLSYVFLPNVFFSTLPHPLSLEVRNIEAVPSP